MQITDNTFPKKLSSILIIIAAIALILGLAFYFGNQDDSASIGSEDIQITRQENFYGISGTVLEVRENSIVIETPAIPYRESSPLPSDRWVWAVYINDSTEIIKLTPNDSIESDIDHINNEHTRKTIKIDDIKIGDLVVVTSSTDIKGQFVFDEKQMTASKIEVF